MEVSIPNTTMENSDEELPDLFGCNDNIPKKFEIIPGDIVWAKYQQLYWPSLVRSVNKKLRKVRIWYLDSPQKSFILPFNKIKNFSDPEISNNIKEEIENSPSPVKALHRKAYYNAISYIVRKAQGFQDDPAAYFNEYNPYLSSKNISTDSSSEITKNEHEMGEMYSKDVSSDEESLSISEDSETVAIEKKMSKFFILDDTNENAERTDAIVNLIKAGRIDCYLNQIKSKKVFSQYQEIYDDAMKTDRTKLFNVTACDIVRNLSKLREISFYLMDLYEKTFEGCKFQMIDYITSVWLPESINKAAQILEEDKSSPKRKIIKRKISSTDHELSKISKASKRKKRNSNGKTNNITTAGQILEDKSSGRKTRY